MNRSFGLLNIVPLLLVAAASLRAQERTVAIPQDRLPGPPRVEAHFVLQPGDSVLTLSREFIVAGSEVVRVDSGRILTCGVDYLLDERYGRIWLAPSRLPELFSRYGDSTGRVRITVRARAFEFSFPRESATRIVPVQPENTAAGGLRVVEPIRRSLTDDLFGPGIRKSGTLVRGFTVATNRDLTLNSGFRMQLAGKLADDVDVSAALTDENSPIQPEGTTQTLREVDKVYVEVRNPSYSATLGDFNLELGTPADGEFGRLNRKLQGARGIALFDKGAGPFSSVSASLTGATARGKYQTNQFQGQDGVQGPYRLSGVDGEPQIVVVAGSERVYIDGQLMSRGEANDYTIDYASGEVTFASRRLITSASRIVVDFEYADQQYTRNLVGGGLTTQTLGGALSVNTSFYQEADDPDAPISTTLDDQARSVLAHSGTDRFRAALSGIRNAGRDSVTGAGLGQYLMRDTVIAGRVYSILVYAPGDPLSVFTVVFSPVDQVPADSAGYVRISPGQFRFAGPGSGNYMPLQFLPMPQLHRVWDVNGTAHVAGGLSVDGEFAASRFNANRFASSAADDGNAYTLHVRFNPDRLMIGGSDLGQMNLVLTERRIQQSFLSLDRVDDVEFNREWNVAGPRGSDEELRQASLEYRPMSALRATAQYGLLDRQGDTRSVRVSGEAALTDSVLPSAAYRFEDISTDERVSAARSQWLRQSGEAAYRLGPVLPGVRVEAEDRQRSFMGSDSLTDGSFRILDIAPHVSWNATRVMSLSAEVRGRWEDSAAAGAVRHASDALTQTYTWQLRDWRSIRSTLTLSARSVRFTERFRQRGNVNDDVLLIRSQSRFTPWNRGLDADVYYEFSNQKSSRLERVFVRVARGSGNYRYLGDLNGNHVADEAEFEQTRFDGDYVVLYLPSEQMYPVANVQTALRLRVQPERLMSASSGALARVLRSVSSETSVRIDEKSRDPETKQITLLNLSHFLNDQTTISGSQSLTEDLFVFENARDLSFRLRYSERRGLLQLVTAAERSFQRERSLRIRSQLVPEIGNQTDLVNSTDAVAANASSPRVRAIASNSVRSDFSYRPDRSWEAGFTFGVNQATNAVNGSSVEASMNDQALRLVYAMPMTGQIRGEFRREEVSLGANPAGADAVPFELTQGRVVGKTWQWQASVDYRVTANIQLTLQYQGRSEGGREPVHSARAEARAFF